ncbi:type I polyketide synthase [Streptomyces sp. 7-21]|uniref:type I polyketide synthase n=1 Tax=Streptomyces sp. 7-21 TaxID=2802283 RepID=UPI00191D9A96|nr:type I polyketide synthase [Streptomyces sp. 7-21]MBL1065955.1 SDR family NAD(P)-dependent oxidoreductase [Streptomyces sp. 7-21]
MAEVAIVGIGLRLPGGIVSLDGLWQALTEARDLVGEVPPDRYDKEAFTCGDPDRPGRACTAAGGFLGQDLAGFDAEYFGISPKEASRIDPQHRLLLECAVEALDDAGIDPAALAGSDTAVITGVSSHDYADLQQRRPREITAYTNTGTAAGNAANRLSHVLDLTGPSFTVDTACSSALTAVHQACEALRSGRSRLALAGAVNVLLNPAVHVGFSAARMLSPTGTCRPFAEHADGYVRAEGAGVLVLKPLAAAVADGDRIHGVIAASAVNADGRTSGLSLPDARSQARLLASVYGPGGLDPREVAYVEAHGTGTPAGDPVECEALGAVLGRARGEREGPLPIGSVKGNLGHPEAASGIAGIAKALLVLRERVIPPTPHAEPRSGRIDFEGLRLAPVPVARPLRGHGRTLAGVNSFGFGGANAHVVLAPAPPPRPAPPPPPGPLPLVVTARSRKALDAAATAWADHLDALADAGAGPADFADAAYTACRRRAAHPHRVALLARSPGQAAEALRSLTRGAPAEAAVAGTAVRHGRVGFVFSGNGSQWPGMGAALLARAAGSDGTETTAGTDGTDGTAATAVAAAFAREIDAIDAESRPLLGWSIREELLRPDPARWSRTEVAQPLLFAVQAGLVAALAARGVTPHGVCGHSVGEVAAAYAAGALDRAAACRVVAARSRAQAVTAGSGRMAALGLGPAAARQLLAEAAEAGGPGLCLAAVNSDRDVTVTGDAAALAALGSLAAQRGVFFRDLGLDYAFHGPAMDRLRAPLAGALAGLTPQPGRVPVVSTVTGGLIDGAALDAGYWWRNVREPVLFADAVAALTAPGKGSDGCDVLLEIGPHPVLGGYLRRAAARAGRPVEVVPTLTRTSGGAPALDAALARLLAAGARVDLDRFFPAPRRVVSLPPYPWQRERHWHGHPDWWLGDEAGDAPAAAGRARHPLLGARASGPEPGWRWRPEPGTPAWLGDHTLARAVVVPGAAYVDMALAAGQEVFGAAAEVTGLTIERALALPFDDPAMDVRVHTALSADGVFTVSSRDGREGRDGEWIRHARGRVRRLLRDRPAPLPLDALRARLPKAMSADEHYATCAGAGLTLGPAFRVLTAIRAGGGGPDGGPLAELLVDYAAATALGEGHLAHPTLLDAAFQGAQPLMRTAVGEPVPFLPAGVDTVRCWGPMPARGAVHLRTRRFSRQEVCWDATVTDERGEVALELLGCVARRFDGARAEAPARLVEVMRAAPLPPGAGGPPGGAEQAPPVPVSPAALLAAAGRRLAALRDRWHEHPYGRARHSAAELAAHFTGAALTELLPGLRPGGETFTVADLLAAGAAPEHERLLSALLAMAAECGLLAPAGGGRWRLAAAPDPAGRFAAALREFPGELTTAQLHGVVGRRLAAVLRGECDVRELLFSGPEPLATRFYDASPVMAFHNGVAAELLRELVAHWPASRPLRVLEVGAGTGGTTACLLPHLPPRRTRYTYTDVSASFLVPAERRFAGCGFMDFRRLDLDQDPAAQGFAPGSFDLVIASNALHTARDLAAAVRRVAGLLVPGGHLLAIESHEPRVLLPLFGPLPSFWSTEDRGLRPHGMLLPRERWPALLAGCGFTGAVQAGDDREPARGDCSVILAARDNSAAAATAAPAGPADRARRDGQQGQEEERRWAVLGAAGAPLAQALRERFTAAAVTTAGPEGATDVVLVLPARPGLAPAAVTEAAAGALAALRDAAAANPRRLWLVTLGADGEPGALRPPAAADPVTAAAWGAARTLANERPRLDVRRVSVLSEAGPAPASLLHELLAAGSGRGGETARADTAGPSLEAARESAEDAREDEVLLTATGRFVPRVVPLPAAPRPRPAAARSCVLRLTSPGSHYRLTWEETPVPEPGPGQVRVRVAAAALNYRDVMMATGRLPLGEALLRPGVEAIGLECSGTVDAVGPGVTSVAPGDRVFGGAAGCFASHALLRADRVMTVPPGMSFASASTLPMVWMTVHHSLRHLARLAPGETVLVHGAAGGVGLAALRYAQLAGARVIATAGTGAKRDLLRLLGAGAVLDSRSLRFAEDVMDLTDGQGVDVVLNSLAGEGQWRSLGLLRPHGRFVELGKRDFLADNQLPQGPFARNLTFFGVDVSPLIDEPSALADSHISELRRAVARGDYPPLPHRVYPAARIDEAFTAMRHSRHTGKLVVTFDEPLPVRQRCPRRRLDPDATYLITGGFTGLGADLALRMAERGARHLTLVGRRGAATPGAEPLLARLAALGTGVDAHAADASDEAAMRAVFARLDASGRRLAGVAHAAMVLADAPLAELSDEDARAVLTAKLTSGCVLDSLTRGRDLDFFVVFSSAAALVGNLRQAAYAAANTGLEALVHRRRRDGLPGLAVQFGALSGTGYLRRTGREEEMAAVGLGGVSAQEALSALDDLLDRGDQASVAVGRFDWGRMRGFLPRLTAPRTRALLPDEGEADGPGTLRAALAAAGSEEEALRLAEDALAGLVGRVLQTDPATLDRSRRLNLLGMDSLMAAELARDLRTRLGCDIPVVELSGAASLTALAHRVLTDRTGPPAPRVPGLRAPQDPGARAGAGEEAVR